MTNINKLQQLIDNSKNIVFFGGAGVSTASGVPDFRSADGIFAKKYKYTPEQVISHDFFINNTKEFYDFYRSLLVFPDAKPNDAHYKLAEMEKEGKLDAVITQNIDNLHQEAGSDNVLELHGSVHRNYCMNCNTFYDLDFIMTSKGVPKCTECNGVVKPDVVLYQEPLDGDVIYKATLAVDKADLLIVGGTSLKVYPAANFVRLYKGRNLVIINKSDTPQDSRAGLIINDDIAKVFSQIKI